MKKQMMALTAALLLAFSLTERELEIAQMTAQRRTRREIGDALGISEKTVSNRLTTIYEKLGLAAQTGGTDASRTVFDALGFNTKAPEGYQQDESLAGTPYGKTFTTMAEVDELFTFEPKNPNNNKADSLYITLSGLIFSPGFRPHPPKSHSKAPLCVRHSGAFSVRI